MGNDLAAKELEEDGDRNNYQNNYYKRMPSRKFNCGAIQSSKPVAVNALG